MPLCSVPVLRRKKTKSDEEKTKKKKEKDLRTMQLERVNNRLTWVISRTAYVPSVRFQSLAKKPDVPGNNEVPKVVDLPEEPGDWVPGKSQKGARSTEGTEKSPNRGGGDSDDDIAVVAVTEKEGSGHGEECAAEDKVKAEAKGGGSPLGEGNGAADCSEDNDITVVAVINKTGELNAHRPMRRHRNGGRYSLEDIRKQIGDLTVQSVVDKLLKEFALQYCVKNRGNGRWVERNSAGNEEQSIPEIDKCTDGRGKAASDEGAVESERSKQSELHYEKGRQVEDCIIVDDCTVEDCTDLIDNSTDVNSRQSLEGACAIVNKDRSHEDCISLTSPHNKLHPEQIRNDVIQNGSSRGVQKRGRSLGSPLPRVHSTETLSVNDDKEEVVINRISRNNQRLVETAKKRSVSAPGSRCRLRTGHLIQSKEMTRNEVITKIKEHKSIASETEEKLPVISVEDERVEKTESEIKEHSSVVGEIPSVKVKKERSRASLVKGRGLVQAISTEKNESNQIIVSDTKNVVQETRELMADNEEMSVKNDAHLTKGKTKTDQSSSIKDQSPVVTVRKVTNNAVTIKGRSIKLANATKIKERNQDEDHITGDESKNLVKDAAERLGVVSPLADRTEISAVNDVINREKDESPSSKGRSPTFKVRKGRNRIKVKRHIIKSANATENKKGNQSEDWVTGDEPKNLVKDTRERLTDESPLADRREISAVNDVINQEKDDSPSSKGRSPTFKVRKGRNRIKVKRHIIKSANATENKKGNQSEDWVTGDEPKNLVKDTGERLKGESPLADRREISAGNDVDQERGNSTSIKEKSSVVTIEKENHHSDLVNGQASAPAIVTGNKEGSQIDDCTAVNRHQSSAPEIGATLDSTSDLVNETRNDVDCKEEQGEIEKPSVKDQSIISPGKEGRNRTVLAKTQTVETKKESGCISASVHKTNDVNLKEGDPRPVVTTKKVRPCVGKIESCSSKQANATANQIRNQVEDFRTEDELKSVSKKICTNLVDVPALMDKNGMLLGYDVDHMEEQGEIEEGSSVNDQSLDVSAKKESNRTVLVKRLGSKQVDISDKKKGNHSEDCIIVNGPSQDSGEKHIGISAVGGLSVVNAVDPKKVERDQSPVVTDKNVQIRPPLVKRLHSGSHNISQHRGRTGHDTAIKELKLFSECFVVLERLKEIPPAVENREVKPAEKRMDQYDSGNNVEYTKQARGQEILVSNGGTRTEVKSLIEKLKSSSFENKNAGGESAAVINQYGTDVDDGRGDEMEVVEDSSVEKNSQEKSAVDIDKERATLNVEPSRAESTSDKSVAPNVECEQTIRDTSEDSYQRSPGELNVIEAREITENVPKPVVEEVGVLLIEKEDESESDNTSRTEGKERTSDWRIEKEILKDGVVVQRKGQIEKYVVAEPANYLKDTEDKGTDGGWTAGSERSKVVMEDEVLKENKDEGKIEDTNKTDKETMVGEYVCVMETEETSAEDQVLKEKEVQMEKYEVERKNEYSDEAKDKEMDEESMLVKKKEQLIVQDKAKKHVIEKDPKELNELNNKQKVTKPKSYRKIDKQAVVEESIPDGEREKQIVSDEGGEKAGGEIEKHLVGEEDKDKTEDTNETCNRPAAVGNTSERRSEEVIVEDEVIKIPEVVEGEDAKVPKVAEDEVAKVPIVEDVVAKLPEVVADKVVKNCEVVEDDVANIPKVVDEVAKIRKVTADDVPKIFKCKNEVAKFSEVDVDEVVNICEVVEDEVARIPKVIDEVAKNRIVEDEVAKILQVIADGVANIPKHDNKVVKIPEIVVDEVVKIAKVQIENSSVKIAKAASEMKDNRIFVESTLDKKRKSMFVGNKVVKKEGELIGKEDSREGKDTRLGKDKILVAENTSDKKREKMDVEDKIEMSLVKKDDREIVKTKGLKDKKVVGEYSPEQRKDKVLKKTEEQNKTCLSETKRKRKIVVRTLGKKREKQIVKNKGAEGTKELNEKSVLGKEGECKTVQERQRVIGEYVKGMKEKQMVKDGMCAGGKEMGYIRKGIRVHTVENRGHESPGVEANEGKCKKTVALKEVHRLLMSPRDENEESTSRKITGEEKNGHLQVKGTLHIKEGKETDKSPAEQTSSKPKFRVRRRLKSDDTGVRKSKVVMTEEMRRRKFEKYLAERKRVGLLKNYTIERVGSQMSSEDRKEKGLSDEVCKVKKEEPQIRKFPGEKSVENKDKVKSPQIKKSPGMKIVENKDKVKSPLMKKSPGEKSAENMDKVESPFEKHMPGMRKEQMEISKDEIAGKKCRIKKKLGKKSEKMGEGQIEKRQAKAITENKDLKHITKHTQESKRLLTKQYSVNEEVRQFGEQADKKIEEKVKEISRDEVTEMTGESQGKYVKFESKKEVQIENSAQRPIGTKEAEENIERLGRSISVAESKVKAAGESKDKMPEEETFIEQKKSDMETAVNEKIPVGQDFIFKGVQNQTEVCPLAAENKILNDASLVMNESNLKDVEIISELDEKTQQTEARIVVEDRQELNSELKFVHIENCLIVKDEMSGNRECVVVKEGDGCDKITEEEERQINQCTMVQKVMNQEYKIIELSPQVKKGEIRSQEQKQGEDVTMMIEGANEVQDSASQKEEKRQNEESTEVIQNGELTSRNRGGQSGDCAIVTEEKSEVQGVQEGDGEEKYGLLSEESRETDCSKREEVVSDEHLAMSRKVQVKEHVVEEERETEAAKGEGSPVTSTESAREVCRIENEGLSEVAAWTSDVHVEPIPREECSVEGEGSGQSENQRIVECFVDAEESKIIEDEECKAHEDVKKSAVVEEQQNEEPEIRTKMQDGVKEDETQFEEGNKSQGNVQGSIAVEEEKQTVEVIKDAKDVGLEDVEKCVMHVEKEKECEVGNKPQDIVEVKMDAKDEGLEDVEKCVMPVEEEKEDHVCEVGIQEGVEVKMDDKDEGLEDMEKCAMPVEGEKQDKECEVENKPQEDVEVKMDNKIEGLEDVEKCAVPVEENQQDKDCEVENKPHEDEVKMDDKDEGVEDVKKCAMPVEGEKEDKVCEVGIHGGVEVKLDDKDEGLEDVEKCAMPVEEGKEDKVCEVGIQEGVEVKMVDKDEVLEDVEKCAMPVEGEKEDKVCEVGIQEGVEVKMVDKDEVLEDVEKCAMPVEGEKEDKVCEVGIQEGVEVKMDDKDEGLMDAKDEGLIDAKDEGLENVEKCAMPVEEDKQDRDYEIGSKPQEVVEVKMDDKDEGIEDVEKCAVPVEGEKEDEVFEVGIQEGVEVKMDDKYEGIEDVEKCAMAVEGEKQDKECEVGNKPQEDVEDKMDNKVEGLEDVEKCVVPVEENQQDKDCEVENKPHEDVEVKMEDKDEGVEDVEKCAIPLEGEKLDKVCEVGNKPQEVVEVKMDGQDEGLEDVEKCAMPVEEEEQDKDCEVENKPPQEESYKQIESGIVNKMQEEAECVAFEEEGKQNEVCDVRADVERSVMNKENEEITQECVDRSGEVLGSAKAKEAENKDRATENSTYVVEESTMEKEEFDFGITRKAEGEFDEGEIVTGGEKQIEEAGTEIKTEESIKSEEEERLSKEYVVEKDKIGELSDENKSQAQFEKTVVIEELSADSARQTNVENESLKCLVIKEEEIHKICESSLDIKDDKEMDGSAVESQQEVKIEDSVPDGNLSIPVESTCASDVKVDILSDVCRPDSEVEGPTVISGSENQIAICTIQTEGEGEIDLCTIEKIRQFIESTVEGREVAQTGLGIVNNLEERCGSICSVDSSGKRQLCICGIENEGQVCSFETGGEDAGHLTDYTVENGGGNFTCSDAVKDKADGHILFCSVSGDEPRVLQEHMVHGNTISISVPAVEEGTHVGPCLADIDMERHVKVCTIENESERHIGDCTVEGGLDPGARCCTVEITRVIEREGPDDVNRELGASRILYDQDGGIITLIQNADAVRTNVTESCGENGEPVIQVHITEDGVQKGESDFESEAEPEAENELEEEVVENVNDLGETIIEEFVDKDTWENQIVIVMEGVEAVQVEAPAAEPGVENAKKRKGKVSPGVRQSKPRRASQSQETPKRPRGRPKRYMRVEADNEGPVNKVQQNANGRSKKARIAQRWKNDTNMLEGHTGVQQNSYAGSHAKKIILTEDGYIFPPLGLVTKAMLKQMPEGMDMTPVGGTERKFEGKWKKAMISKVMHKEAQLAAAEIEKALGNDPLERSGIRKSLRRRSRSQGSKASAMNVDNREPVYTENVWREALESPMIISGMKAVGNDPLEWTNQKGGRRSRSQGNEPSALNMDERDPAYTEHVWREALEAPVIIPGVKEVRTGLSEDGMNKARMSPIVPKQKMVRRPKKAIVPLPQKKLFRRFKEIPQNIKADFKNKLLESVQLVRRIILTRKDLMNGVLKAGKPIVKGGTQILSIMTDSEEEDIVPRESDNIDGTVAKPTLSQSDQPHVTISPLKEVQNGPTENELEKKDVDNVPPSNSKPKFKKPRVARAPKKLKQEAEVIVQDAICSLPDLPITPVENTVVTNGLPESDAQKMMVVENLPSVDQSQLEETLPAELTDNGEGHALSEVPPKHQGLANGLLESSNIEQKNQDEVPESNTIKPSSEQMAPSMLETKDIPNGEVLTDGPTVPLVQHKDQVEKPQEKKVKKKKKKVKVTEGVGSGSKSNDLPLKQEDKKNAKTLDKAEESNGSNVRNSARPPVTAPPKKVLTASLREKNAKNKSVEITSSKKPEEGPKGISSPLKALEAPVAGSLKQKAVMCPLANCAGKDSCADKLGCSILPLKENDIVSALPSLEELMGPSTTTPSPLKDEAAKKEEAKPQPILPLKKKISREIQSKATAVEENSESPDAEQKKIIETLMGSDPKKKRSRAELLLMDMFAANSVGKVSEKEKPVTEKPVVKKIRISPVVSSQTKTLPDKSPENGPKKVKPQGLILIDLFKKEKERKLFKKSDKKDVVNGKSSPKEGLKSPVTSPKHKVVKGSSSTEKVTQSAEVKTTGTENHVVKKLKTVSVKEYLKRKHSQEEVREGLTTKKLKTESKDNATSSTVPNLSTDPKKSDGKKQPEKERRKSIQSISSEGQEDAKKLKPESKENPASSSLPNLSVDSLKSDGKKPVEKERRKSDRKTVQNIPYGMEDSTPNKKTEKTPVLDGSCPARDEKLPRCSNETEVSGADGTAEEGQEGHDAKKLKPESEGDTASSNLPNLSVDSQKSDEKKPVEKERRRSDRKSVQNIPYGTRDSSPNKKTEVITPVLDGSCPAPDEKFPRCSNETDVSGVGGTAQTLNGEHSNGIANGLQSSETVMSGTKGTTKIAINDVNHSLPLQQIFKLRECFVLLHRLPEDTVNSLRPFRRKVKKRKKINTRAAVPGAGDQTSTCDNSAVLERLSPSTKENISSPLPAGDEQHSSPQSPSKKQLHVCAVCGERFLAASILYAHTKKHSQEESSSSPDRKTVLQDRPRASVQKKQGDHCPYCLRKFKGKKNLILHLKKHSDAKACKCYMCDKTFLTYYNLFVHMRTHTKEHIYPCYICQKTFAHPSTLQIHIEKHHTKKRFKCFSCEKSFMSVINRSAHMKKHHENGPA